VQPSIAVEAVARRSDTGDAYGIPGIDGEKRQRRCSASASADLSVALQRDQPFRFRVELSKADEIFYGGRKAHASPTDTESS
jgi:hypothetical protein